MNKSGAKILQIDDPKDIIGQPLEGILPKEFSATVIRGFKQRMEGEEIHDSNVLSIPIGENKVTHMEAHVRVIDFDGTPAVLTSMRDVTPLIKYQRRLEVLHNHAVELDKAESEGK